MRPDKLKSVAVGVLCAWTAVACGGDSASSPATIATAPLATKATVGAQLVHLGVVNGKPTATRVTAQGADAAGVSAAGVGHVGMRNALAAFVARGPLSLVLVDRPLAGGALAEVYVNGPTSLPRFLVVPRSQLNDEILDRADALVRQYEAENPNDHSLVKFTITPGGQYDRTSATETYHGTQLFEGHYARPDRRSRWLLESALRVAPSQVPSVGEGRVMILGTVPRR